MSRTSKMTRDNILTSTLMYSLLLIMMASPFGNLFMKKTALTYQRLIGANPPASNRLFSTKSSAVYIPVFRLMFR